MNSIAKKAEVAANVAIIVVAALLAVMLAGRYLSKPVPISPGTAAGAQIQPGTKLSLPGVDWGKSEHNLLMVLSTGCHFCSESAPFYQRLTQDKGLRGDARLIAMLPQDVAESQKYLGERGIVVDEIRQAPPSAVQARGTPTLLLVDKTGTVTDVWVGRLPPDKEGEVFDRLRTKS